MAEPTIITRVQAQQWLKGAADSTIRNHFILAYLRKEGRMTTNMTGRDLNWVVEAREPVASQWNTGGGAVYDQSQVHETLSLGWAGIHVTDAIDEKIKMMNTGPTQIVDLVEQKLDSMTKKLSRTISQGFYAQNTGTENELIGIRTPCVAHGSVAAADRVAALAASASYAGKSVALGALGGSWSDTMTTPPSSVLSNDWPMGSGTPDYDYLSPKLVNYSSTGWDTGSTAWRNNCEIVMRRGLSWAKHLNGETNSPSLYLLSLELYDEFKDSLAQRERLYPESYAKALGFPPSKLLEFNGAIVTSDYYCPAGKGYAINAQEMELMTLTPDLMVMKGPFYDENALAEKMRVSFLGQYRFNPKAIVEFGAYA
jgi:hypothetical protein